MHIRSIIHERSPQRRRSPRWSSSEDRSPGRSGGRPRPARRLVLRHGHTACDVLRVWIPVAGRRVSASAFVFRARQARIESTHQCMAEGVDTSRPTSASGNKALEEVQTTARTSLIPECGNRYSKEQAQDMIKSMIPSSNKHILFVRLACCTPQRSSHKRIGICPGCSVQTAMEANHDNTGPPMVVNVGVRRLRHFENSLPPYPSQRSARAEYFSTSTGL